jgi:regulator of cell morphogenesis and NO signaling
MMNHQVGGCMGGMGTVNPNDFCPALKQLYDEHAPLREQMENLQKRARELQSVSDLNELLKLEQRFKAELDGHSEKEEGGLFPMIGRYIGTEVGPIAVMEYEHSEAKRNLELFESGVKEGGQPLNVLVQPLQQAIHILLEHFLKEENVLFPLAQRMLSEMEKEELQKAFAIA